MCGYNPKDVNGVGYVYVVRARGASEVSIGEALLRVRTEKGLTQREVALATGLAVSYISRIENDRVQPTVVTVQRLAQAIEVPLATLFRLDDDESLEVPRCPVSSSGQCIGRMIRSSAGRAPGSKKQRYSKEELRLLKMTDLLVTSGSKEIRQALAVVLESLLVHHRRPASEVK